jgi:hypothetical protein
MDRVNKYNVKLTSTHPMTRMEFMSYRGNDVTVAQQQQHS